MFRTTPFFLYLIFGLLSFTCAGQVTNDSLTITVTPYLGLRSQIAAFNKQLEIQDNASRFGTELSIKKGSIAFIAATEIQLNMFKGGSNFNADANLSGEFLTIQLEQPPQVFGNRLGYLGIDLGSYGKITIGKQWSVYRDVTSYTDQFNVFGAKASATFIAGTDGGANGTGRADQSLIYRNKIGRFHIGTQLQLRGVNNNKYIDGFGISAQVKLSNTIVLGSSYNRAFISANLLNSKTVLGLNGHPTYLAVAAKYQTTNLTFSAVAILQNNGDFTEGFLKNNTKTESSPPSVVFDAKGLELFSKYQFHKIALLAGYNLYLPSVTEKLPIATKFKRNDIIAGMSYQPLKYIQINCEQRLSFGKTAFDVKEPSVFTIGMKLNISNSFIRNIGI